MKDSKLTDIMLRSLRKDPKLAAYHEWESAGDFAMEIRFFPHAFNCYYNAMQLERNEAIAEKVNDVLDRITNILEVVPPRIKNQVEDIRLNNPLDPTPWLQMANSLLKSNADPDSVSFTLAFCAYCSMRSGLDVTPINEVLGKLLPYTDISNFQSKPLDLKNINKSNPNEPFRLVSFGDNVTLGLQNNWEIRPEETYSHLWAKARPENISVANCGVSGAGVLDAVLYLGRDVLNYNPNIVFIHFGINDAWLGQTGLLAYETLLEQSIKLLQAQCKSSPAIVLISPIPHIPEGCPEAERPTDAPLSEVDIKPWAEACKRIALRTNVALADTYAEFPQDVQARRKYFTNAFNQVNLEGYLLIKRAIDKL
jgi:lysophospholipase L1-like esterase